MSAAGWLVVSMLCTLVGLVSLSLATTGPAAWFARGIGLALLATGIGLLAGI
jgi:hypothetical protein